MKRKIVALFMITVIALTAMTVAVTAKTANAASTQAPVGGANVQVPALAGSAVGVGTPAIVYIPGGIGFFIFVKGSDGALWVTHWGGMSWSTPTSLGGQLTSDPTATLANAPSGGLGLCVAVRGTDGALWMRETQDGGATWSSWQSLGGQLLAGTGPGAGRWLNASGSHAYAWYVTGTNHALYGWNLCGGGWESLGGYLTSSPAAASTVSTASNVFVRGSDGALWTRSTTNGGASWNAWASLGGQLASGTGPAACAYGSRIDAFVEGTNGALWHRSNTGTGWSGWQSLGGQLASSPAAAADSLSSLLSVLVRGTDGNLWQRYYQNGAWTGWELSGSGM